MNQHVIILGGGVIGLATAEACVQQGHQVTLVERQPETRDGCSFGNAGMIVPSHFVPLAAPGAVSLALRWMFNPESPLHIQPRLDLDLLRWGLRFLRSANRAHVQRAAPLLRDLHLASRELFLTLAQSGEDFGLVTRGLLMLCQTPQALHEESAAAHQARQWGVPADILDAPAVTRLDPGVDLAICGAVHYPKDCHLRPDLYGATLQRRAAAGGARLLWDTAVEGWQLDRGRLTAVRTSTGLVHGDTFVLCGGVWSDTIVRPLGLRVPMQAGKGYAVTVPHPVQLPQLCSILTEARVAVTPMNGALRFGGTMELAGLDDSINARRVEAILRAALRYFPAFRREHFEGLETWHGLRPVSPDGLPYLGRTRAHPNLIVATGHAMMGLSLAPITGEIVARLAANQDPGFDLTLLDPERYC